MSSHFCSDRSWCFFRRPVDISSCFAISRRHADICGEILFTRKSDHLDPWSWQRNKSAKPKYDVFLNRTKCFFVAKLQHKETFSAETYSANSKAVTWATGLVSNHNNSVATQHEHTCGFNTSVICRNIHCQHVFWRLGWRLRGNLQFLWWLF